MNHPPHNHCPLLNFTISKRNHNWAHNGMFFAELFGFDDLHSNMVERNRLHPQFNLRIDRNNLCWLGFGYSALSFALDEQAFGWICSTSSVLVACLAVWAVLVQTFSWLLPKDPFWMVLGLLCSYWSSFLHVVAEIVVLTETKLWYKTELCSTTETLFGPASHLQLCIFPSETFDFFFLYFQHSIYSGAAQ